MGTIDGETRVHQHSPTTRHAERPPPVRRPFTDCAGRTCISRRRSGAVHTSTRSAVASFRAGHRPRAFRLRSNPPVDRRALVASFAPPTRARPSFARAIRLAPSRMFCAISGTTPEEPVISSRTGHLYEKSLITKALQVRPCDDPSIRVRPAPALAPRARDVSIPRSDPSPAGFPARPP